MWRATISPAFVICTASFGWRPTRPKREKPTRTGAAETARCGARFYLGLLQGKRDRELTVSYRCQKYASVVQSQDGGGGRNTFPALFLCSASPRIPPSLALHPLSAPFPPHKGSWNYRIKFDVELPLKSPEHGRLVFQVRPPPPQTFDVNFDVNFPFTVYFGVVEIRTQMLPSLCGSTLNAIGRGSASWADAPQAEVCINTSRLSYIYSPLP